MVGKVQFLNFSESERIRKKVSLKSNKRHMDFYLLLDNSSRFDNCKQYPNVASQQIWHKCPKCLCNPHPKTKVATTTGKGTPIMLCNAIYYTSVNNSQFSISLSLRPATFQRWAIFKTRPPNDPKMTFCTTKSKTTHALLVLPRPKMSLIFALWTTFFDYRRFWDKEPNDLYITLTLQDQSCRIYVLTVSQIPNCSPFYSTVNFFLWFTGSLVPLPLGPMLFFAIIW